MFIILVVNMSRHVRPTIQMPGKDHTTMIVQQVTTKFEMSLLQSESFAVSNHAWAYFFFDESASCYHLVLRMVYEVTIVGGVYNMGIVVPKESGGER